jgi:heat shock protein HslJ
MEMTGRYLPALLLSASALAAASCAAAGREAGLEGTSWILTSLDGQAPVVGSTITAAFEADGKMGGNSGCNGYGASYEVNGDRLAIDDPFSTMMACEPALMDQETAYLAALTATATYAISGESLSLKDASGVARLLFRAQPSDLGGTSWTVLSYNNGQGGVVSILAGTELTAEFSADGQLSGSAGCNTYSASYSTAEASITIGPAASTRMYCAEPEGVMEQETQYLSSLTTASSYSMRGSSLELRTADGALAAKFQAAMQ